MFDTVFAAVPVLETARCTLRPVTTADIADMFRLMSNPDVTRFLGRLPMAEMQEAVDRVELLLARVEAQTGLTWMVVNRESGEVIGNCMFFNLIKAHFRAELGYALLPAWWGQGLVSEIVTRLMAFAFTDMGLHSIEAKIDPQNGASRRVLEKQGFVQEGYFRQSFFDPVTQNFVDTAVFSLVKK
jgi:[ribosomal protein S5]-alanine N-acetyltransferase